MAEIHETNDRSSQHYTIQSRTSTLRSCIYTNRTVSIHSHTRQKNNEDNVTANYDNNKKKQRIDSWNTNISNDIELDDYAPLELTVLLL